MESKQYEFSDQDDECSIIIQFLNGWTKSNILYIPLIILKFTYNRCNKVKIYRCPSLIICLSECLVKVLAPFQKAFFRISICGIPTCFTLLNEAEWVECALNTSISIPALETVFLIHQDIVSFYAALCGFN